MYCTSVVGMYEVRVPVQRRDTGSGSGPDLEAVGRSPNSNAFRQQRSDAGVCICMYKQQYDIYWYRTYMRAIFPR
jgi:hypothetical protein